MGTMVISAGAGARLVALAAGLTAMAAGGAENLVFNGDFEDESPARPPAGWAMWGAQLYKDPANYTRDTATPHSGAACLRIHHPAGTGGYIVAAPEKAIRPRPDTAYTIRFWARAEPPGPAIFQCVAYESIDPFVDAPWPVREVFQAGPQWQSFEYTITEGWEFHADRTRYLMLSFVATGDRAREGTLWVDDVTVTAAPSTREGRLVDEGKLSYEPLNHRLAPGDRLAIVVDTRAPLRETPRRVGGISFHRVCGWTGQPYDRTGRYTLDPRIEAAIRELRLPMTRFYGVGDEPFGLEGALDRVAEVCDRVAVPQAATVLELETQGASRRIAPDVWARAAAYSRQQGYGFRLWEVANEPYLRRPDSAFATPDDYAAHVRAVSAAVRQAQPDARIGIAITDNLPWGHYLLRQAAGSYDFVVHHYYAGVPQIHRRRFEVAVLTENYALLDRVLRVHALIRAYNPGREVTQLDTEWGVHSSGPNGEVADAVDRNANIVGTLHRAVRLLYYAREGMLEGASSWQMLNRVSHQGFGVLAQEKPDQRFMIYWLYHTFNGWLGKTVLDLRGTAPYYTPAEGDDPITRAGAFPGPLTPVLATLSEDGQEVFLMAVNGSWAQAIPMEARLSGFAAGESLGLYLSSPDMDAKPLLERREDFVHELQATVEGDTVRCTLPPHSASFLRVRAR